jgi:hypothetical protein
MLIFSDSSFQFATPPAAQLCTRAFPSKRMLDLGGKRSSVCQCSACVACRLGGAADGDSAAVAAATVVKRNAIRPVQVNFKCVMVMVIVMAMMMATDIGGDSAACYCCRLIDKQKRERCCRCGLLLLLLLLSTEAFICGAA